MRSSAANLGARAPRPLLALLATLSVAACAGVLPPQTGEEIFAERDGLRAGGAVGLEVLTVPEGQRVMLIKSPDDVEKVCSPRESDQGTSVREGLQLALPGAGGGAIGEDAGTEAVALSQPTAVVQLARELLFRACELSLNLDADPAETRAIYERFLATLESVAGSLVTIEEDDEDDD
jgi:hypothetical protein